jgi:hypothetical protein
MCARVRKSKIEIVIADNFVITLSKRDPRVVRVTKSSVLFKSPLLDLPVPVPLVSSSK